MSRIVLDSVNSETLLSAVHLDVQHLVYDSCQEMESWNLLAEVFPNLTRIDIKRHAKAASLKQFNSAFFACFANLSQLQLTLNEKSVTFALGADAELSSLVLKLGGDVREVSLDLENCSVQDLSVQRIERVRDTSEFLIFTKLGLPNTLNRLELDIDCQDGLPSRLLGKNHTMQSLSLCLTTPRLPKDLLGDLTQIDDFSLQLCNTTEPLAQSLLAQLTRADRMHFELQDSQISGVLLPQGLEIEELFYRNRPGALTQASQLSLPKLRKAWMFGLDGDQLDWLDNSPLLEDVNISFSGQLKSFPKLPLLTELTLHHGDMQQLPQGIRESQSIERLSLLDMNSLSRLGDMSQMCALQKLWIQPWHNEQQRLPCQEDVLTLPALRTLRLDVILKEVDPAWARLPKHVDVDIGSDALKKEWRILKSSSLSDGEVLDYLRILQPIYKPAELPTMPADFHLLMMAAKYNRFKAQHKAWLTELARENENKRPFGAGCTLFVAGRTGFKVRELKDKALEIGFSLSKKLDNSVTHILLGTAPKDVQLIDAERYAIIDEAVVQRCFEQQAPKFLQQQESDLMCDTVLQMLSSPDEASHKVAVEMLEQGGVTEAMRLPLFFILKTSEDNKLRKQIKQLLAGMGDEAFQLAVNDRVLFHTCRDKEKYRTRLYQGQHLITGKLHDQRKRWGESLCMSFSQLYFERFGYGLSYVLTSEQETEQRLKIIEQLVEGRKLNWRRGLGLDSIQAFWLDIDNEQEAFHWNPVNFHGQLQTHTWEIPRQISERHHIQHLDLGNCLLDQLPKGIEHFSEVISIDLAHNVLQTLPEFFSDFTQLQELDLSYNHFEEFPEVLLSMPWLKKLDIRRATRPVLNRGYDDSYVSLQVPQAFLDANPGCEVLQDE